MGTPDTGHDELVAGLRIKSGKRTGAFYTETPRSGGTITGIATDVTTRRKVLVTNLHVMAGGTESLDFQNPAGTEQMFHPTVDPDGANLVVTVNEADQRRRIGGKEFTGLVELDCGNRRVLGGDSGAGCYLDIGGGRYRLVCIVLGRSSSGRTGWAFPASRAKSLMAIRFGNTAPQARIATTPDVFKTGETVRLDGSQSSDADWDDITYEWNQLVAPGGTTVGTNPLSTSPILEFTAPDVAASLSFELNVMDVFGAIGRARRHIEVVAEEIWGEWEDTDPVVYRGDGLTRERKQTRTSNLRNVEVGWVSDREPVTPPPDPDPDPPPTPGNWIDTDPVVYRGDGLTRERKQTRTWSDGRVEVGWVSDAEPIVWYAWQRTGRYLGSGSTREVEEIRLSNYGDSQTRWIPDPEEIWGPWVDTGQTRYLPSLIEFEKEQQRTSSLGNTETRWVYSHTGP